MAFGWASTDFPPVFLNEYGNGYLLSEHIQSVSKELSSHEIPMKLSLTTLYWASGGGCEGKVILTGNPARARTKNNGIASASDSCSIEKNVTPNTVASYSCAPVFKYHNWRYSGNSSASCTWPERRQLVNHGTGAGALIMASAKEFFHGHFQDTHSCRYTMRRKDK